MVEKAPKILFFLLFLNSYAFSQVLFFHNKSLNDIANDAFIDTFSPKGFIKVFYFEHIDILENDWDRYLSILSKVLPKNQFIIKKFTIFNSSTSEYDFAGTPLLENDLKDWTPIFLKFDRNFILIVDSSNMIYYSTSSLTISCLKEVLEKFTDSQFGLISINRLKKFESYNISKANRLHFRDISGSRSVLVFTNLGCSTCIGNDYMSILSLFEKYLYNDYYFIFPKLGVEKSDKVYLDKHNYILSSTELYDLFLVSDLLIVFIKGNKIYKVVDNPNKFFHLEYYLKNFIQ